MHHAVAMKYSSEPATTGWAGLRSRLASFAWLQPRLVLQCVGMIPSEAEMLERLLLPVGAHVGLRLSLHTTRGDVVVIEQRFALKMPPAAMDALVGARPMIVVGLDVPGMISPRAAERLFETRQRQLLQQFSALPIVRQRSRSHSS